MQQAAVNKLTNATADINCNADVQYKYIPWPGLKLVIFFSFFFFSSSSSFFSSSFFFFPFFFTTTTTLVQPDCSQSDTSCVQFVSTTVRMAPFGMSVLLCACRHHVQSMSVSKLARGYATNNLNSGQIRQNSKYVCLPWEQIALSQLATCRVCCGLFYLHHAAVCC